MEETQYSLSLSQENAADLLKSNRWTRFMAIIGVIGACLYFLGGICYAVSAALTEEITSLVAVISGIICIAFAIVYFYIYHTLLKSCKSLTIGLTTGDSERTGQALKQRLLFWKSLSILTIAGVGLVVLAVIIVIIAALVG